MDLFENQVVEEKTKNKKMARYVIIAIITVLILCLGIGGTIVYLQSLKLKVSMNGAVTQLGQNTVIVNEDGTILVSLRDIANQFGYEYLNGEYGKASEDTTKGFVRSKEEIAAFEANSKKIYKTPNSTDTDYSYFHINEAIKLINGKLYTSPEGIKTIFNVKFDYDSSKNSITIYTLDYLTEYYTTQIIKYGYREISNVFNNKKAMVSDMLVVTKEDGKKGVITSDGKEIVGAKYDEVEYVETTKDFLVMSSSKQGLVTNKGQTKIGLLYDGITLLDKDLELYVAENNSKYGVLDKNGNILIYLEYDKIGIDKSQFKSSDIKNPYLLFDNCIPVEQKGKWGIFSKTGKIILPVEYEQLGCVVGTSSSKITNNVIIIPDYEAIIVAQRYDQDNKTKYGIYNSIGKELIPIALDSVYSITDAGKEVYEMEYLGQRLNVESYFKAHNIYKTNKSSALLTEGEKDINITNLNAQNTNESGENTATTQERTAENTQQVQ